MRGSGGVADRPVIYASEQPFEDRLGVGFYVWADEPDEAHPALYAVGADPEECRARYLNSWEAYRVTPEQFADLIGMGLTITDKFGPAIWCAERDGDKRRLEILLRGRANLK